MTKKRFFEVMDDINQYDTENGTQLLSVCPDFVEANKAKAGAKITMGAPEEMLYDLINDKRIPVLLLIDKEEYKKRFK